MSSTMRSLGVENSEKTLVTSNKAGLSDGLTFIASGLYPDLFRRALAHARVLRFHSRVALPRASCVFETRATRELAPGGSCGNGLSTLMLRAARFGSGESATRSGPASSSDSLLHLRARHPGRTFVG